MGQKVSGLTNKVTKSVSSLFTHSEESQESTLAIQRATPFVYKRTRYFHYRDVRRDVTDLRIYLCGWQEIKNFDCLSMKAQL